MTGQSKLNPIGASIGIGQEGDGATYVSSSPLTEENRLCSIMVSNLFKLSFNGVECFVPGNPRPLPFSSLSCTFHGVEEPIRMIDILCQGEDPWAESSLVPRMILVSLYFHQSFVFYIELDATSAMAASSRRPDRGSNDLFLFLIFIHSILLPRDKIFIILTDSKNRFNGRLTFPSPLGERDG
jgi:hypothetical protein